MVIFENAGPFAVARRVLSEVPQRPYDLIAYGGGRSLLASLGHLRTIERRIDTISYVGDLDWAGLDIFVQVRTAAREIGLPDVIPAAELHRQMLSAAQSFGHPEGWPNPVHTPGDRLFAVLQPLDVGVRDQVASILTRGNRVPEEVLGPEQLRAAWRA